MHLESSYDLAFINDQLTDLEDFFGIFPKVDVKIARKRIYASYLDIGDNNMWLFVNSLDSFVMMVLNHFLVPLKNIIPEHFNFGAIFTTFINKENIYIAELKIVDIDEINLYTKNINKKRDSRVSVVSSGHHGEWLVIIRLEKPNVYERKLLE